MPPLPSVRSRTSVSSAWGAKSGSSASASRTISRTLTREAHVGEMGVGGGQILIVLAVGLVAPFEAPPFPFSAASVRPSPSQLTRVLSSGLLSSALPVRRTRSFFVKSPASTTSVASERWSPSGRLAMSEFSFSALTRPRSTRRLRRMASSTPWEHSRIDRAPHESDGVRLRPGVA